MVQSTRDQAPGPMPLVAALEVLRALRSDEIVVTTMGAAREWPRLSDHPLDLHYIPSAMGEAPALGLGLALARPDRHVVVLNGDGCMLMNLGALVTIAAASPANLTLVVMHNGRYEVTGGQQLAAEKSTTDFAVLATAAGIGSVAAFSDLDAWRQQAAAMLAQPGPRFIVLDVAPVEDYELTSPGPMPARIQRFREALGAAKP